MAKEEKNENLSEGGSAEAQNSVSFGIDIPNVIEGRTRRGRSVATLEVGEGPFVDVSVDTFGVPSEQPLERNEDPQRILSGPEPTVFGGVNPETPDSAVTDPDALPVERTNAEQIGGALDEQIQAGDLLESVPKIDYVRIIRSTPFLLCAMLASLLAATVIIRLGVATETYVQTSMHFSNYRLLNEAEQGELQKDINTILRNRPLRETAIAILQTKKPDLKPGFLNSSLVFHRLDSIVWFPDGKVQLRIDSNDPEDDVYRVQAVRESFYVQMDERNKTCDQYVDSLKQLQQQQAELNQEDAKLNQQIRDLSPKAETYGELKQSMQELERYLEVADESNPLRIVARQNQKRLSEQVQEIRQISMQRDDLTARRMDVQKKIDTTANDILAKKRQIDLFPVPDPPDANTPDGKKPDPKYLVRDTRPLQTMVLRITWISLIVFFGCAILLIHLQDQRAAEAARRERRERLKSEQQRQEQQEQLAPDEP